MNLQQKSFELYNTILRFIVYKATPNLRKVYLDVDRASRECTLTGIFKTPPTEDEKELFDDIETNSQAHIPDYTANSILKTASSTDQEPPHEFTVFAWNEGE